jgi:hypothetical protein
MLNNIMLFLLGLLVANAGEWVIHKYILHGLGRHKNSIWAYHLREHHAICLQNAMLDKGYQDFSLNWNSQTKEWALIFLAVLSQLPLLNIAFWYVAGIYATIALYYYCHRKSHMDAEWAKRYLPWHYEHHLGGRMDGNWCITWPLFDYLMGTRRTNRTAL